MIVGRLSTVACSSTRSGVSPSAFLCVPLLQSSDSVPYIVVCLFTVPGVHCGGVRRQFRVHVRAVSSVRRRQGRVYTVVSLVYTPRFRFLTGTLKLGLNHWGGAVTCG
jgi:hypothetical protein